jgi:hypothetical protein
VSALLDDTSDSFRVLTQHNRLIASRAICLSIPPPIIGALRSTIKRMFSYCRYYAPESAKNQ